jgi:hypothetical protein
VSIIHRPVFYLKHDVSENGCLYLVGSTEWVSREEGDRIQYAIGRDTNSLDWGLSSLSIVFPGKFRDRTFKQGHDHYDIT